MDNKYIESVINQLKENSKEEGFIEHLKTNIIEHALQTDEPKNNLMETIKQLAYSGLNIALNNEKGKDGYIFNNPCKVPLNGKYVEIRKVFKDEDNNIKIEVYDNDTNTTENKNIDELDVLTGLYPMFNVLIDQIEKNKPI